MKKLRYAGSKFADFCNSNFVINYTNNWGWIICGLISEFNKIGKEKLLVKRFIYEDSLEYGYLPITPSELDSAYSIENYCEYNGDVLKCVYGEEDHVFALHLGDNEELCRRYGIGHVYDRYIGSRGYECFNDLWIVVPEDEVLDVWEQRSPIKGFPFHGPERVYVRKDGVWLR